MKTKDALILGIALIAAALVFGVFHFNSRRQRDVIAVVGAATGRYESDIVKWRVTIGRDTGLNDVSGGYELVQADVGFFKKRLVEAGVEAGEISVQPVNSYQRYSSQGQVSGYTVEQGAYVASSDVETVEGLALNPGWLVERGTVLKGSRLEYLFSDLTDVKLALLADATRDARRRAEEIALNSGVSLGGVVSLQAGVFQIREPFSTEVSDYGMYSTQTRQKDITVTVRATFLIK